MGKRMVMMLAFALIAASLSGESWAGGTRHFSNSRPLVARTAVAVTSQTQGPLVAKTAVAVTNQTQVLAPSRIIVVRPVPRVIFISSPFFLSPFFYPPFYGPMYGYAPAYSYEKPSDYLYFCPDTGLYYPDTTECPSGWLKVVPGGGEPPR